MTKNFNLKFFNLKYQLPRSFEKYGFIEIFNFLKAQPSHNFGLEIKSQLIGVKNC